MDAIEYLRERKAILEARARNADAHVNEIKGGLLEVEYAIEQLTAARLLEEVPASVE